MTAERPFELQDGRRVAVHQLADGRGESTVVLCHAAPGAGNFDPDPAATERHGVRLVGVDRPGYGGSEPIPSGAWASVSSAADDVAQVVEGLELGRVAVAGWSAGGRVALALAARRPDLVDRVAVIATPAPNEHVPWIPPQLLAGLEALRGLPPDEVHAALEEQLAGMVPGDPAAPEALGQLGATDADEAALARPGARDRLSSMLAEAFAQGAAGMAADIAGYCLAPWGFEPDQVTARTLLVYGAADPLAGPPHGAWYQQHLPDARLETAAGAGHLLIIQRWDRILAHLAAGNDR